MPRRARMFRAVTFVPRRGGDVGSPGALSETTVVRTVGAVLFRHDVVDEVLALM